MDTPLSLIEHVRREAEAVARLRYPNIIPIDEVGRLDGVPYYAMEFIEGGSLAQRLRAGSTTPGEAARLIEALASAVEHELQRGVMHRDLKPGNVLLGPDLDSPRISDFGLAKRDGDGSRTETGARAGRGPFGPRRPRGGCLRVGCDPLRDAHRLPAVLRLVDHRDAPARAPGRADPSAANPPGDPARPTSTTWRASRPLCAGLAAPSGASGDAYVSKAMEWLRRARSLGLFRDPDLLDGLDRDSDLDFLRSRRDFQL
jgi:serine/threonine protein kinase